MVGIEVETTSKGGKIVTAAMKKKIDETSWDPLHTGMRRIGDTVWVTGVRRKVRRDWRIHTTLMRMIYG
jgi:hypothetical protein